MKEYTGAKDRSGVIGFRRELQGAGASWDLSLSALNPEHTAWLATALGDVKINFELKALTLFGNALGDSGIAQVVEALKARDVPIVRVDVCVRVGQGKGARG